MKWLWIAIVIAMGIVGHFDSPWHHAANEIAASAPVYAPEVGK